MTLYFYISVAVLALLLFFPTSRLIWVISVRSLTNKRQQQLTESELNGQKSRARFIAVLICVPFSWFFNQQLLGMTGHG